MLRVTLLTVEVAGNVLIEDASFTVSGGEKVGIVGRNGAGKTSLLSVLLGRPAAHVRHRGEVSRTGTFTHLPQVPIERGLGVEPIGLSHVLSARGLDRLDADVHAARAAMATDPSSANIERFSDLESRFTALGGYGAEAEVARLAEGLGLREELLLEDLESLSGGQRRRVDLMRVLYEGADTMVLDEPTNHLDRAAKRWLFDELAKLPGTLLLISHDLALLDQAIDKVLHVADGQVAEYKGNYSAFLRQSAEARDRAELMSKREGAEIRRLKTLADERRHSTEKRARQAKVFDRKAERIAQNRTRVAPKERSTAFRLPAPPRSGDDVLELAGLKVAYGRHVVLRSTSMLVGRGDRILVVGRNGAGKSSLLRCLAGVQEPTAGSLRFGAKVELGYFAQEHEQLDEDLSALEHFDDSPIKTEMERRKLLGAFGLTGETVQHTPDQLSGGERAKLALALLAAGKVNLLVLDEPTNNLDPASVVAVARMLTGWPGTVVAVSHERAFAESLAPTHAVLLPEEHVDLWRDEYLDLVEQR
ncbi:MAG TPA: ABC-F family ATP-binding cassette domain-containing protein [Acidimicrobiales bacterium]